METGVSLNAATTPVLIEQPELNNLLDQTQGAIDPFCTMCSSPEDQMLFFDELVSQNWDEFLNSHGRLA